MPNFTRERVLIFGILFLLPIFSHAQVVINEISYSPQGKSWIEIYNGSASAIDLTQYKILDSGATVNGHGITAVSGTNPLPPQSYAIIAKDPTIFPGASFSLFKSSLGANTSGDTFTLKNGSTVVDSVSFLNTQGANGDGNSLQRQSDGTWAVATPTPGNVNSIASANTTPPPDNSSSSTDTTVTPPSSTGSTYAVGNIIESVSTHYSYVPLSDFQAQQTLSVSAGRNRLAVAGNAIQFQATANIADDTVVYTWTFGDGTTAAGKLVKHAYEYAGTYTVVLNAASPMVNAVARTIVTVVEPKLAVLEADNRYIKIENGADKEINLYGWEIVSEGRSFVFPLDTIILGGESICFPADVTNLSPIGTTDVVVEPISSMPVPNIPRQMLPSTVTPLQTQQAALFQQLVVLKQQADALATSNPPARMSVEAPIEASSTDSAEVATPINAAVSSSWLSTLKHFFFGTQ
jgi:hypothetical protein